MSPRVAPEGGHRVPFLIRWPGRAPAGTVNGSLVVLTDLMATFGEIVGAKFPTGARLDGVSIVAALRGQTMDSAKRTAVIHHSGSGQFAIRSGPWKLIFDGQLEPIQLYNLDPDLREQNNRLGDQPDVVARRQQEFQRIHQ